MPDKKKVLVTGFGGRIGKVLRDYLGDKYEFSGIDRIPPSKAWTPSPPTSPTFKPSPLHSRARAS